MRKYCIHFQLLVAAAVCIHLSHSQYHVVCRVLESLSCALYRAHSKEELCRTFQKKNTANTMHMVKINVTFPCAKRAHTPNQTLRREPWPTHTAKLLHVHARHVRPPSGPGTANNGNFFYSPCVWANDTQQIRRFR